MQVCVRAFSACVYEHAFVCAHKYVYAYAYLYAHAAHVCVCMHVCAGTHSCSGYALTEARSLALLTQDRGNHSLLNIWALAWPSAAAEGSIWMCWTCREGDWKMVNIHWKHLQFWAFRDSVTRMVWLDTPEGFLRIVDHCHPAW